MGKQSHDGDGVKVWPQMLHMHGPAASELLCTETIIPCSFFITVTSPYAMMPLSHFLGANRRVTRQRSC